MRKLATVRTITDITPILNADKIELAHVDGWQVVVRKDDGYKVGDKIVYIEIDSVVPETPEFEFLRDRKFRVRIIKLRGERSEGLIMPMSILDPEKEYNIGDDVTDELEITKYDPEERKERQDSNQNIKKIIPTRWYMRIPWLRKIILKKYKDKTEFPKWIIKTDEERIQNMPILFESLKKTKMPLTITEKIDGQSATYFLVKKLFGYEFGVCSRNYKIDKSSNQYWQIAEQYDIKDKLKTLIKQNKSKSVVLQGEIIGEGIQGNKYKIKGYDFYAFNLLFDRKRLGYSAMFASLGALGIRCVPYLGTFTVGEHDTIEDIVKFSGCDTSTLRDGEREGVVCRNQKHHVSFKCINPNFLLKEGENDN